MNQIKFKKKNPAMNKKGKQKAQKKITEIDPVKYVSNNNNNKCKWAKFTSSNTEAQIVF